MPITVVMTRPLSAHLTGANRNGSVPAEMPASHQKRGMAKTGKKRQLKVKSDLQGEKDG
jgi:hypothetical protein